MRSEVRSFHAPLINLESLDEDSLDTELSEVVRATLTSLSTESESTTLSSSLSQMQMSSER
jgi:hypothetical protein